MTSTFDIYKGKKVLITGHTGFKGSWLSVWLKLLKADVYGLSLNIPTSPSNFEVSNLGEHISDNRLDITNFESTHNFISTLQPDFIFHLAAQPLVRQSYKDPLNTIMTNAIGTSNILNSINQISKSVTAVLITSDKVYDNKELERGYIENDRLGGKDPYSASKGMAELAIRTFFQSYFKESNSFVRIGIARAGNVIGGGDWADDRIIADCVRSWSVGEKVKIRNPDSTRPWQHVLEPLSGYLTLGSNLYKSNQFNGESFNFGPKANQNYSVRELISQMKKHWADAQWVDCSQSKNDMPEANLLQLNCDKAFSKINWSPVLEFDETVKLTTIWYKNYYENPKSNFYEFTLNQIKEYINIAKQRFVNWTV